MPRQVSIRAADFDLFDQDLSPSDYEFFKKHTGAFKRMLEDQSRSDKLKFIEAFREFSIDHGCTMFSKKKLKCEAGLAYVDESVKYFQDQFVSAEAFLFLNLRKISRGEHRKSKGKFSSAKGLVMDAVTLAVHRNSLQYMDSNSFIKDPFVHKETREVFRRLFGEPTEEGVCVKVVYVLPLHIKFAGALCRYLKRWLDAEDKEGETSQKQAELISKSNKADLPPTTKVQEKKPTDTSLNTNKAETGKSITVTAQKDCHKEKEKEEKKFSGHKIEKDSSTSSKPSDSSSSSNEKDCFKAAVMITSPTNIESLVFLSDDDNDDDDDGDDDYDDDIDKDCKISSIDLSANLQKEAAPQGVKPGDSLKDISVSFSFLPVDRKSEQVSKKDDSMAIVKKLREESKKSSGGATHVVSSESDAEEWESKIPIRWVEDDSIHNSVDASVNIEADGSFTKLREELHLGKPHPNEIYEEQQRRKRNEGKVSKKGSGRRTGDESHKQSFCPRLHTCANCRKSETSSKSFKKCARCKGKGTRFYCSRECQGEDWVARHRDEHIRKDGLTT